MDPIAATLRIATLPSFITVAQISTCRPAAAIDLAVDVGADIYAHHVHQSLGLNLALRLFVTAPRLDDVSIKLIVHRSSMLVGHSFRKRARNGERKNVPPRLYCVDLPSNCEPPWGRHKKQTVRRLAAGTYPTNVQYTWIDARRLGWSQVVATDPFGPNHGSAREMRLRAPLGRSLWRSRTCASTLVPPPTGLRKAETSGVTAKPTERSGLSRGPEHYARHGERPTA